MSLFHQQTQLPESNRVYLDVTDTGVQQELFSLDEADPLQIFQSVRIYEGLLVSDNPTKTTIVLAFVYGLTRQYAHRELHQNWPNELQLVSSPFVQKYGNLTCRIWFGFGVPLMAAIPFVAIPTSQLPIGQSAPSPLIEVPSPGFKDFPAVESEASYANLR